jgi:hypothetical protein
VHEKKRSVLHGNLKMQAVHMKCIPFYCNFAHELEDTGMKNKYV